MTKYKIFVLSCCMLFINVCFSQEARGIDSLVLKEKLDSFSKKMIEFQKMIIDGLDAAYNNDTTVFNDKNGKKSITKVLLYITKLTFPERQNTYNDWAQKTFTDSEYHYFNTLKFTAIQTSGVPVLNFEETIDYDLKWLANFYTNTTLILKTDFNYYENIYYLMSYDITGIIEPPYISKILSADDILEYAKRLIVNIGFEFFIIMHEFYHSFYEKRLSINTHNELAADSFAVTKWNIFIRTDDSDKFVNDSYLLKLSKVLNGVDQFNLVLKLADSCKSKKIINDSILYKNFTSAFLGKSVIDLFLRSDSRYFLTNVDQIELDLMRSEKFNKISLKAMMCSEADSSIFCCTISRQKKEIESLKELTLRLKSIHIDKLNPDTAEYKKLNKQDPAFIPFCIGNYYIKIKDYNSAVIFYSSVNKLYQKTEYTILCNLLCFEIYNGINGLVNNNIALNYLNKAKELNTSIKAIRKEIIESLVTSND